VTSLATPGSGRLLAVFSGCLVGNEFDFVNDDQIDESAIFTVLDLVVRQFNGVDGHDAALASQ
jgi:hypothetical protein